MKSTVLTSADGTNIAASTFGEGPYTFVIAHGMTGNRSKTGVKLISTWFSQYGRVVVFDQRGHGESGGSCTMGFREPLDLDAAVAWAKSLSDAPIITVGFSLGASVATRHAALATGSPSVTAKDAEISVVHLPDATVLVSSVAHWFYRGSTIMDRLFRLTATPWGRYALRRTKQIRVSVRDWADGPKASDDQLPTDPRACASIIRHPLLLVHGDKDHYFPESHAEQQFAAASGNPRVALWVEPEMGHAERATTEELVTRIADWVRMQVPTAG